MHASQVVSTSQAGLQALVLVQRTFAQILALFYIMHSLRGCHSVMLYKCNYIVKEFSVFSSCSIILLTSHFKYWNFYEYKIILCCKP